MCVNTYQGKVVFVARNICDVVFCILVLHSFNVYFPAELRGMEETKITLYLREAIRRKNLLIFGLCPKGGGSTVGQQAQIKDFHKKIHFTDKNYMTFNFRSKNAPNG